MFIFSYSWVLWPFNEKLLNIVNFVHIWMDMDVYSSVNKHGEFFSLSWKITTIPSQYTRIDIIFTHSSILPKLYQYLSQAAVNKSVVVSLWKTRFLIIWYIKYCYWSKVICLVINKMDFTPLTPHLQWFVSFSRCPFPFFDEKCLFFGLTCCLAIAWLQLENCF